MFNEGFLFLPFILGVVFGGRQIGLIIIVSWNSFHFASCFFRTGNIFMDI